MLQAKKIVHLVHSSSKPGGIEVLLPLIINSMQEYVFKVFVIRKPIPSEQNVYKSLNISAEYGSKNNFKAFIKILIYTYKNRKNIFHVFNIGPFFLLPIKIAGAKNLVYSIHGTKYWKNEYQKLLIKFFWRINLNKKVKITSNSEYSREIFLDNIIKKYPVQVLYNPINLERFYPLNIKAAQSKIKIIYVGRLSKGKGLERWIDIAWRLHEIISYVNFEIYGTGPVSDLLKIKIKELNAENYIFLKGFRSDIENVYREADLLLFLSEYESFGNVVVESILCGTPVLVSDIPSMREIFKNFPEFIIKSENNIVQTIYTNLRNITMLKERALVAREVFMHRFSPVNHFSKLREIYESFGN